MILSFQCNAKCGKQGEKYRTFHCVWYKTKKSAGDACKNVSRPLTRKSCKGHPCDKTAGESLNSSSTNKLNKTFLIENQKNKLDEQQETFLSVSSINLT